jgi:hypothetical protein
MAKLMGVLLATLVLATLAGTVAEADMTARTTDGKDVLLKENGTWKYLKQQPKRDKGISIRVLKYGKHQYSCGFMMEITNRTGRTVDLGTTFAAYDSVSFIDKSYFKWDKIRKGKSRIDRVSISANCDEVKYLKLLIAEFCKFDGDYIPDETCLSLIHFPKNTAIKITKE